MSSDAAPGAGDVIIEDTDPRVVYDSFANWTTSTDGSLSNFGSTYHYTDTRGAWVFCTFTGTHIWYIANTKYNHGNNSVTIDAGAPIVFSSYSPELNKGQVLFHDELPAGTHRINVSNLDALVMGIDRFAYRPIGIPSGAAPETGSAETKLQDPISATGDSSISISTQATPSRTLTLSGAETTPQGSDTRAASGSRSQHGVLPVQAVVAIGIACGLCPLLAIAGITWLLRLKRRRNIDTSVRVRPTDASFAPPVDASQLPSYQASIQSPHHTPGDGQLALKRR